MKGSGRGEVRNVCATTVVFKLFDIPPFVFSNPNPSPRQVHLICGILRARIYTYIVFDQQIWQLVPYKNRELEIRILKMKMLRFIFYLAMTNADKY
jgi:hypothetical protein